MAYAAIAPYFIFSNPKNSRVENSEKLFKCAKITYSIMRKRQFYFNEANVLADCISIYFALVENKEQVRVLHSLFLREINTLYNEKTLDKCR